MSRITLVVLLLGILSAQAAEIQDSETRDSRLNQSRSRQSESEFARREWGLSEKEWQRYQTLMKGIRGSLSPSTISPIEVLGIHAESEAERSKYARLFAKIMHDDTERTLRFAAAYQTAWRELYPDLKPIDIAKLPQSTPPASPVQAGDRVLLFLRQKDCVICESLFTRIDRAARQADAQLDIYFVDTQKDKDDDKIRAWAAAHNFDPARIEQGKITFNHDQGALNRAAGPAAVAPSAWRIRAGVIDPLPLGSPGL